MIQHCEYCDVETDFIRILVGPPVLLVCKTCYCDEEGCAFGPDHLCTCCGKCDHSWDAQSDWMGDPTIPNGTVSWVNYTCRHCGEETTEQPEGYEAPERDWDAERDERQIMNDWDADRAQARWEQSR